MARKYYPSDKARATQNDLYEFETFCREFGYRFNEKDLYDTKAYPFQQFMKFKAGKRAKNMWEVDAEKFGAIIE